MTRKIIIGVIVLLVAIALIIWGVNSADNDNESESTAILSVSAYNQTKNSDASTVEATPNDLIEYSVTAENQTEDVIEGYIMETNIADITELATLIDAQGANYNSATNSLIWTPLDIPANGSIQKKFIVRVKDTFPTGSDMVMTTKLNNEVVVRVARAQVAGTDTANNNTNRPVSYTSPTTGVGSWLILFLSGITTLLVAGVRTGRIRLPLGITNRS